MGSGGYGKFLYFPLNLAMNLKLLFRKVRKKRVNVITREMFHLFCLPHQNVSSDKLNNILQRILLSSRYLEKERVTSNDEIALPFKLNSPSF